MRFLMGCKYDDLSEAETCVRSRRIKGCGKVQGGNCELMGCRVLAENGLLIDLQKKLLIVLVVLG